MPDLFWHSESSLTLFSEQNLGQSDKQQADYLLNVSYVNASFNEIVF